MGQFYFGRGGQNSIGIDKKVVTIKSRKALHCKYRAFCRSVVKM
ncbi:hypothetical protein ACZ87_03126 [Candidatus Erwinia dacicola]|uniref:Uncharacterized protein n=1 Tax=Candidatus Erwinia dacicola TaxID=252393 RepID=A0A328TM64_9GAMM|nr:hypothetical protein ACZ87_03126 [Candidatus Erwinia dacicola]